MPRIEQEPASAEFFRVWQAAGQHIERLGGDALFWLRASLFPPVVEHLSFRMGNRIFFVFVRPMDGVKPPSTFPHFLQVAEEATAIPVLLQMERTVQGYRPTFSGWGLRHGITAAMCVTLCTSSRGQPT